MRPRLLYECAIAPALTLLPQMRSERAEVQLLATSLLESDYLRARRQYEGGPARGFWQFEKVAVRHVLQHPASQRHIAMLCRELCVDMDVESIHEAIEYQDILAAGVARLNYWTDRRPLAPIDDADTGWTLYVTIWRPGKPAGGWKKGMATPDKWYKCWRDAIATIHGETS